MIVGISGAPFLLKAAQLAPAFKVEQADTLVTASAGSMVTVNDAVVQRNTPATIDRGAKITTSEFCEPSFSSLTPSIAAVDTGGNVRRVSDGTATIIARTGDNRQRFDIEVARTGGQTIDTFDHWVPGSLAKACADSIDSLLVGRAANASTLNIYSTPQVRNPGAWCASLHAVMTAFPDWDSQNGTQISGVLITARHMAGCAHAPKQVGTTVRFIGPTNVSHSRTIVATLFVPGTDIQLWLLDSALPAEIKPVKIPPPNFNVFLSQTKFGIPCLLRNQFAEARVSNLIAASSVPLFSQPSDPIRSPFYRTLVVGDSGGPAVLVVNGELVLVTTWTTPFGGPRYWNLDWEGLISELDGIIDAGTALVPEVADFSGFPSYG